MFAAVACLLGPGLPSPAARTSLTTEGCEKSCIENAFMWPGKDAREKICDFAGTDCQGCRFCNKKLSEAEALAALDADCFAHDLCGDSDHEKKPLVKADAPRPKAEQDVAAVCYEDASKPASGTMDRAGGVNQCGEQFRATCTGSKPCCSASGWCGSDEDFCGKDMQVEFSHGKNLCAEKKQLAVAEAPKVATACYENANLGENQCGEAVQATCAGSNGLGACCSEAGWCGSSADFCGGDGLGAQPEFSFGKNLCKADSRGGSSQQQEAAVSAPAKPEKCLKDANAHDNQCGPEFGATCTGSSEPGVAPSGRCCASSGWCGNDPEFCEAADMQVEYSYGKNLCGAEPEQEQEQQAGSSVQQPKPKCLTVEQVAVAWVSGVSKLNASDAVGMCVPAVIIAAGSTYNAGGEVAVCKDTFDPTVEAQGYMATLKGLWQIADDFYDEDPKKQAAAAYELYTGDDKTYGCLALWCRELQAGCSEVIPGIGQDPQVAKKHRFCSGVWSGAAVSVPAKLQALGGEEVVRSACEKASAGVDVQAAEAEAARKQEEAAKKAAKQKKQAEQQAAAWTKGPCPKSMDCWGEDAAADVCVKCTEAQEQEYEQQLGPDQRAERAKVKPGYGTSGGLQGVRGPGESSAQR